MILVLIFENLIAHLEGGGIGVVHFTYAPPNRMNKLIPLIKSYIPLARNVMNLLKGQKFRTPEMQMNTYDLNDLLSLIQKANVVNCYTEFTNHGGWLGVVVYFKMPKKI